MNWYVAIFGVVWAFTRIFGIL